MQNQNATGHSPKLLQENAKKRTIHLTAQSSNRRLQDIEGKQVCFKKHVYIIYIYYYILVLVHEHFGGVPSAVPRRLWPFLTSSSIGRKKALGTKLYFAWNGGHYVSFLLPCSSSEGRDCKGSGEQAPRGMALTGRWPMGHWTRGLCERFAQRP